MMFGFFGNQYSDVKKETDNSVIQSALNYVSDEVTLAYTSEEGYKKVISLPLSITGMNYLLNFSTYINLVLTIDNIEHVKLFSDYVVGEFCINNSEPVGHEIQIEKSEGEITLTSCPDCNVTFTECQDIEDFDLCAAAPESEECCTFHCKCC